ncbi:TadE/TadG family type IV pilus assembly protein, partial [Rhodopseudomonas sp. B29]|uniref:TadE/TadG family type IV pilus assembly protein n=1 Tax=Rhodopseudomonas sp. B29 TaxID=95607 RepID=UPI0003B61328
MFATTLFAKLRSGVNRFCIAENGNIAVIFALALVPLVSFIGAAIDYSRANKARTSMQAALDSAALMVSKDDSAGNLSASDVTSKAQAYFNALYTNTDVSSVNVTAAFTNSPTTGAQIKLTGFGAINTSFLKLAGFPNLTFGTSSTTAWGTTKLRVAMALDNTGSMADDGKISALITASKNLVDQLSASAKSNGDVY